MMIIKLQWEMQRLCSARNQLLVICVINTGLERCLQCRPFMTSMAVITRVSASVRSEIVHAIKQRAKLKLSKQLSVVLTTRRSDSLTRSKRFRNALESERQLDPSDRELSAQDTAKRTIVSQMHLSTQTSCKNTSIVIGR